MSSVKSWPFCIGLNVFTVNLVRHFRLSACVRQASPACPLVDFVEELVLRMPGPDVMHNIVNMDIGFQWVTPHIADICTVLFSPGPLLTHLPQVPHIYASVNWVSIGSGNGLAPEPMLPYCQLDPWEQLQWNSNRNMKKNNSSKCVWMCRLRNGGHLVQGEMNQNVRCFIRQLFARCRFGVVRSLWNLAGGLLITFSSPSHF